MCVDKQTVPFTLTTQYPRAAPVNMATAHNKHGDTCSLLWLRRHGKVRNLFTVWKPQSNMDKMLKIHDKNKPKITLKTKLKLLQIK